ncbi:MAG TPA: S-adenosylmethionine:tRNA ribosyltransferase-isomerase [Puia sp.]|jgi:S-adenosylmethionine:tRNA ribosyltransferase-isomerase|nr:S-adenosylmethionine:tRNA ribosyltransferase-isomerase [Puia sp.]
MISQPGNIAIDQFSYPLEEKLIAKYPLAERDASRLLIYQKQKIREDIYRNIDRYLPKNSLLIFNDTRVIEARILFQKQTGGIIEIFCLEPEGPYQNLATVMGQKDKVRWKCLIGGASKWKKGEALRKKVKIKQKEITLQASYVLKESGYFILEFSWLPNGLTFGEILHAAGLIPLPPYIKREADDQDAIRYQTIYAAKDGSVAAPTAGLHFTHRVMEKMEAKNISREFITLHVGAGTFKPMKGRTLREHQMHEEFIEISKSAIEKLVKWERGRIVAVGTTSLRTIESLYWLGVKVILEPETRMESLTVKQWDPYLLKSKSIHARSSLQALAQWMDKQPTEKLVTKTQLLISPGYEFRMVNALITNFHQPHSTLLLLVAALIGKDWKKVYQYAMDQEFRFLSYGDGCLLFGSNG